MTGTIQIPKNIQSVLNMLKPISDSKWIILKINTTFGGA